MLRWSSMALLVPVAQLWGQGIISTVAGSDWIFPGNNRPAITAPIGRVVNVAVDATGNVYLADVDNFMVMRVRRDGILEVVAGNGIRGHSGEGELAVNASIQLPRGLAFDSAGNLYFSDFDRHRIRRVSREGVITTIAGQPDAGFAGDGGPAASASLNGPRGIAFDAAGNLYVADSGNHRIRRISTAGVITTVAGTGAAAFSGENTSALAASLNTPSGVAFDAGGNLVFADTANHRVRRISPGGVIATVAGNGVPGFSGDGGSAVAGALNRPIGVAVAADGRVLFTDAANHRVRVVSAQGVLSTVAGDGRFEFAGDGGPATSAGLNFPEGVAIDSTGNIYIADFDNSRVRRVSPGGAVSTIAGNGAFRLSADNQPATSAALHIVSGIAFDAAGNLYLAENQRARVRKVAPNGTITTVAGNGTKGFSGERVSATTSSLFSPSRLAVDSNGNLFISDNAIHRIRRVSPANVIETIAGTGAIGFAGDGGPAVQASLNQPEGIAVDGAGMVYIADHLNNRIRRVTPAGVISTVAGNGQAGSAGDGGPAGQASLNGPVGVGVDNRGNLYIAERYGYRIRRVAPNGVISTVAGNGQVSSAGDGGPATQAGLNQPAGILALDDGSFFITELIGSRVRRVSPSGVISTVAGNGTFDFAGDGGAATSASLNIPTDVKLDSRGNLYIADAFNNRVRVVLAAAPSFTVNPVTLTFTTRSGGSTTSEQLVQLSTQIPGIPFTVDTGDAPWLRVTPREGVMPAVLRVSVDPSQLVAGQLSASITIRAPMASPPERQVTAGVTVAGVSPPRLIVEPNGISFNMLQSSELSLRQVVISNQGSGVLDTTITTSTSSGGDWLSVNRSGGTLDPNSPLAINVAANPAGLAPATYSGAIRIDSPDGSTLQVPVTLAVSRAQPAILLSQAGLTYTAVAGGATLPSQSIGVLNTGSGVMSWTATASTLSGGSSWLRVSPGSGQSTANSLSVPFVDITADHAGLSPGEYYGQILVAAANADNSPQVVSVVLQVLPQGSNPGPLIRPTGLIFTTTTSDPNPGSQTVTVSNVTARLVSYLSGRIPQDPNNWFVHLPSEASIAPGTPARVVVQPAIKQVAPGIRRGTLTFQFDDGTPAQSVNMLLVVVGQSASADGRAASSDCIPRTLLPLFTALPGTAATPAGWPTPLEVRAVDDCAVPLRDGAVSVSFSNGDAQLNMIHVTEGRWTGTWYPRQASTGPVIMTASAEDRVTGVKGTVQVSGGVQANLDPPVIADGGVLNAAGGARFTPVSPGSIISIYGDRLSEGVAAATQFPLNRQLMGTEVLLAGRVLPLIYVSQGQVNAIIPFDIPPNTSQQLLLRRSRRSTVPSPISVAPAEPGIFSKDQTGAGQGIIFDVTNRLAEPGTPANRGDAVVIYCSGLGTVDAVLAIDQAAPASPLARTVAPVTVSIGGREAQVLFSGLAPGFIGLYQVNAIVPPDIEPGDVVPVSISVGNRTSQIVTIALR